MIKIKSPDGYWCECVAGDPTSGLTRLPHYVFDDDLIDGTYVIGNDTEQILYGQVV